MGFTRARCVLVFGLIWLCTIPKAGAETFKEKSQRAITLIQQGEWDQGLSLLQEVAEALPSDGLARLNYATMVFERTKLFWGAGDRTAGLEWANKSEQELSKAFEAAKSNEAQRSWVCSQSAYLLGAVYEDFFNDRSRAIQSYNVALEYLPSHTLAKAALAGKRLPASAMFGSGSESSSGQ